MKKLGIMAMNGICLALLVVFWFCIVNLNGVGWTKLDFLALVLIAVQVVRLVIGETIESKFDDIKDDIKRLQNQIKLK